MNTPVMVYVINLFQHTLRLSRAHKIKGEEGLSMGQESAVIGPSWTRRYL